MYEMNIKQIHDSIMNFIFDHENIDVFNKEDEERLNALEERINNIMALDERFKNSFINDMQIAFNYASYNGFENGLQIGLSLLKNLLTSELPEIHIVKHEPDRTERRCPVICNESDTEQAFTDYVKKCCVFLSESQMCRIQGRIEEMITDNVKRLVKDLF